MADDARAWARLHSAADAAAAEIEAAARPLADWVLRAWAVKDECQAAWTEEPARTLRCAELASQMSARLAHPEIVAAAAWCDGLAQLAQGRMEAALLRLGDAQRALLALGQAQRAAQSQVPCLVALSMLGRHDEALACGERTLADLIAAGDEAGAGKVELNLGWMLMRRDRHAPAMDRFRRAAVRFARAGDATHSIMADIGLASALTWQFDFDEALRLYERSSARARARGLGALLGVIDTNRGRLELQRGHLHAALRALDAALREAEADGMPHDVAEAERDLGDAYLALNLLPEAVALYDRTIERCVALEAPDERAWAELQRADAMARSGDARRAAAGLALARGLFEADDNRVGVALADLRGARLALQQGDAAAALRSAETAALTLQAAGIESARCEAEIAAAAALDALGRGAEAGVRLQRVLDAADGLADLRIAALTGLGEQQRQAGDSAGARAAFGQAVQAIELQRAALPGDAFRTAYGADKQRPYDALIELALADAPASPWRLLQAIEQARAPALRTALQHGRGADAGDRAALEPWRFLQGQWQQAIADGELERAAALQQRSQALEQAWLEQQRRRLAASGGTSVALPGAALPADEAALRARIPPGTAVVVYAHVGGTLAACVATRERLAHVQTPAGDLLERIGQLRFQIDTLRHGAPALRAHAAQMAQRCRAHLQALHALAWQPLAPWVQGHERIVVVPHRALHYVPFAALHDGHRSLLDAHEITLAPALGLWRDGAGDLPPLRRVAAFGVGGDRLPHVGAEVRAVAEAFRRRGGSARVHLEAAATLPALRDALAGADVLHLACHGQFRADSPSFSALHLADGPLTLHDAAELPLTAPLVTLSACETGLSKVAPGDELLGLVRGFLIGGARRVLATHWTVDDTGTAALMAQFYEEVLAGARPAAALRRAQQALAQAQPHPYHWAAFALHERG